MSSNLALDTVANSQLGKTATINSIFAEVDAAVTEVLAVSCATLPVTITSAQARSHQCLVLSSASANGVVNLPAIKRMLFVQNNTAHTMTLTTGTGTVALAAGAAALVFTDGTTNGLYGVMTGTGGGGGGGGATSSRYWRVAIASTSGSAASAAAIEFRATSGGAYTPATSVASTSTYSGYPASNLNDGDDSTFWAAADSPTFPINLDFDFGTSTAFTQIRFLCRSTFADQMIMTGTLYVSADGVTYTSHQALTFTTWTSGVDQFVTIS